MTRLSVAIPCYEAHGVGHLFIEEQLNILSIQTFKDFEVVISDHSKNYHILKKVQQFPNLNIRYIKNTKNKGSSSANINNAMDHCSGELIKILFQDDFLMDSSSLEIISNNFTDNDNWLVTGCCHLINGVLDKPFYPQWNDKIHLGNNTISSPSVLTIRNKNKLYFDDTLIWMMDVDLYKRYYLAYGLPKIINNINVVNRIWENQLSNTISINRKNEELQKMVKKYE